MQHDFEEHQKNIELTLEDYQGMLGAIDHSALLSLTDAKGNILYVNDKFLEVSKYDLDDLIGQNHRILKSDHQPQEVFVELWKTISSGKVWRGDIKNRAKDGTYYWVDSSIAPILDKEGKPSRYVAIRFPITDRKREEERVEELNETRKKFIDIISHQFRTPITSINWNLEMLLGGDFGELKESQLEFLRATHSASVKTTERIASLLLAMDVEEGRINYKKDEVLIDAIVPTILASMDKKCLVKNITCQFAPLKKDLPKMYYDPDKIRSAIAAMIENGIIYTSPGGTVDIKLIEMKERVRFEVKDSGVGIPAQEQHRIFTRFFRASNATIMQPDAFGLGLFLAKNFIERQGGTIGFESKENEGSTFWFELPINTDDVLR